MTTKYEFDVARNTVKCNGRPLRNGDYLVRTRLSHLAMCPVSVANADHHTMMLRVVQRSSKQELVNRVVSQIIRDINNGELSAIDELLHHLPNRFLNAYLPEE